VAVCAAGLVAGPWVGLAVGAFVTGLAVGRDGLPMGAIGLSMLCGGLAGGWLYRRRPSTSLLTRTAPLEPSNGSS
jgi:hypothetical protein